jgi:hypothetical protein
LLFCRFLIFSFFFFFFFVFFFCISLLLSETKRKGLWGQGGSERKGRKGERSKP